MPEQNHQEIFDNEGHINYDKVVEIVHLNLKNFLNAVLEESFELAKDPSYRAQINETNSKVRDQALDAYIERKHIVASEFYVELESQFYTSGAEVKRSKTTGQADTHSMDTDLIELTLAIDQLIDRSVERHADLIEILTLQLEELSFICHQDFNTYCLQPQDYYKLIQNCISPLNISVDGKILISKLLYQNISPNLNDFYSAMHNFLLDVDINPAEDSKNKKDKQDDANAVLDDDPSNSSIMSMSTGQFFAPVEQETWQQEYETNTDYVGKQLNSTPEIIDEIAMDVYGAGQTGLDETTVSLLLQPYSPNTQSNSSPAQRRQFVRALSSVQRVEAANNAIFQAKQIKTAVRRTLHEKGALDAIEIVANEEKVIDFVSNIFQVILEDNSICDAIKAILARLQISTIKLALIDFTFFQNAKHPARLLLNKLTSIGISASGDEKSLFKRLTTIVRSITEGFDTDVQIFELALSEIQQIDTASLEQQAVNEETGLNKHKLKSQRSAAKRVVIHTIKKLTKNKEIANQVLEFCLKCWAPHMAYVYMTHGRSAKQWRNSVRTLRRIIEVSQGTHSLHDVSQYIQHPNEFFENIRIELEYFTNRNDEFEDILEETEVWYLTYLRKIEQETNKIENNSSEQDVKINESNETQDNVIHLFKNLSPISAPETASIEAEQTDQATECNHADDDPIVSHEEPLSESADSIAPHSDEPTIATNVRQDIEKVDEIEEKQDLASELDSEEEFDENDIEVEPDLNVVEHLPDSIVPGVWLEVYQGEDKAKRRLKFSKAIIETNYLVFSDRSGDYSIEIDLQTFLDDLSTGRSSLISESNRFDLALSSVISNIRSSQDNINRK
ncbi:MAG: DUF1631 family protein [Gammaproteobacteria bacterium]|nr:MAG: DUF1631 family protein [Gammaproteobacteria bacterium]